MIKKIQSHLKHDDFLEKEDIIEIIEQFPLSQYKGEAYRVLLFSQENNMIPDISSDMSFSKTINGVKKYLMGQDLDYYPFCIVFKVSLDGISINELMNNYSHQLGKHIDTSGEDEVCPHLIGDVEIFFKGKTLDFYQKN